MAGRPRIGAQSAGFSGLGYPIVRRMTGPGAAVLFDMDGVIVDSEEHWSAFEETTLLPSVIDGEHPEPDETTGMNFREIYEHLARHYELTVEREGFVARYEDAAREIYRERVGLMPGFPNLCETLRERGIEVAVVSSSPQEWIAIVRERFDLGPFDAVVSAEDIEGPGKPEPDVYEHAAAVLGVDPAACIAVEDSPNGTQAAARAGMDVIGYRSAANAGADLSAADVVVDGPEELRTNLLTAQ